MQQDASIQMNEKEGTQKSRILIFYSQFLMQNIPRYDLVAEQQQGTVK
jgi:hypothetical protein